MLKDVVLTSQFRIKDGIEDVENIRGGFRRRIDIFRTHEHDPFLGLRVFPRSPTVSPGCCRKHAAEPEPEQSMLHGGLHCCRTPRIDSHMRAMAFRRLRGRETGDKCGLGLTGRGRQCKNRRYTGRVSWITAFDFLGRWIDREPHIIVKRGNSCLGPEPLKRAIFVTPMWNRHWNRST